MLETVNHMLHLCNDFNIFFFLGTEEHINERAMLTLLDKEPDSPIFLRLGLSYGKAVMLLDNFRSLFKLTRDKVQNKRVDNKSKFKPTLKELKTMTPKRKQDYFKK